MYAVPNQKNRVYLTVRSSVFFALSAILIGIGIYLEDREPLISFVLKLGAILPFWDSVFIYIRYFLTGFVYIIAPSGEYADELYSDLLPLTIRNSASLPPYMLDFTVRKVKGRHAGPVECVFSLDLLEDAKEFTAEAKREEIKKQICEKYEGVSFFDYTKSYRGEITVLVFRDGNSHTAVLLDGVQELRGFLGTDFLQVD